jgi:O-antigen/teichoic acid export membrane protein
MLSNLLKNSGLISAAALVASVITFLCLPILTRIYEPQQFEDLGVFTSFVAIASSISCLRLNIAIPITKRRKEFYALILLSMMSSIFITIFLSLVFFSIILMPINVDDYSIGNSSIFLFSLACFGMSFHNISLAIASRKKLFTSLAVSKISRSFVSNGCQITLVNIFSNGLIIGYTVFCFAGFLSLLRKTYIHFLVSFKTSYLCLKKTLKGYIDYPLFSVPEVLFFNLGTQLPLVMIAIYTDNSQAGYFFLALRLMSVPMMLLGQSISSVYLAYAPKARNILDLQKLTFGTIKKLFFYAAIPLIGFGLAAPLYVALIFGEQWQEVGYYTALLSFGSALQLAISPVAVSLHILKKQKLAMLVQMLLCTLRLIPLWLVLAYSDQYYIETFALFNALSYLILFFVINFSFNRAEVIHVIQNK